MKKTILLIFFITFLSFISCKAESSGALNINASIIRGEWMTLDNFDSKKWNGAVNWGSWCRNTFLNWGNYHGKDCLMVYSTYTSASVMALYPYSFPPEDWSSVEIMRMDVYVQSSIDTTDIKRETKKMQGVKIEEIYEYNLTTGSWLDLSWDIDQSSSGYVGVKQMIFLLEGLDTVSTTFYFDNLRLVKEDGTTWYWDVFDATTSVWTHSTDAYSYEDSGYQTTENAVSWNGSTSTTDGGSLEAKWNSSKDAANTAKIESSIYYNLKGCIKARAYVKCTNTNADIAIGFWNDSIWKDTISVRVASAATWELLQWDLPSATTSYWANTKVIPIIQNTNSVTSGTVYIDDLKFYR